MKLEECKNENESTGAICNLEKGHKREHCIAIQRKKIFTIVSRWR